MILSPVVHLLMASAWIHLCCGHSRKGPHTRDLIMQHDAKSKSSNSILSDIKRVCLSDDTDRLVYRFQNETHIFIGFDVVKDDVIYTMVWKMTSGKDEIEDQNLEVGEYNKSSSLGYRKMLSKQHLLAATNKGEQRKLKRDLRACGVGRNAISMTCFIEVFAERAQHMRDVTFRDKCVGNTA